MFPEDELPTRFMPLVAVVDLVQLLEMPKEDRKRAVVGNTEGTPVRTPGASER